MLNFVQVLQLFTMALTNNWDTLIMIIKDEKTRRILYLLSWFIFATVTAIIIWPYSKIVAILFFVVVTIVSFLSLRR